MTAKQNKGVFEVGLTDENMIVMKFGQGVTGVLLTPDQAHAVAEKMLKLCDIANEQKVTNPEKSTT